MTARFTLALLSMLLAAAAGAADGQFQSVAQERVEKKGCLGCHEGIERFSDGAMMQTIEALGSSHGDPGGCVICHGGNPQGTTPEAAHSGAPQALVDGGGPELFYPDPGSVWFADRTCGQCHQGYAERLQKALMNTEAGKLQGNLWSWGLHNEEKHKVVWGNYDIVDEDGSEPAVGTAAYKQYMSAMVAAYPDQFPNEMKQVPAVAWKRSPSTPTSPASPTRASSASAATWASPAGRSAEISAAAAARRATCRTATRGSTRAAIPPSTKRCPASSWSTACKPRASPR